MSCCAIRCPRPPQAAWEPWNCGRFVAAPQSLKDFLYRVWQQVPGDARPLPTAAKVYSVYAPGSDSDDFPLGAASEANPTEIALYRWENQLNRNKREREIQALVVERIYLAPEPQHIERLFNMLQVLADRLADAVVRMKRSTRAAARARPDAIVIYTSGPAATHRVLGALHELMTETARGQSTPVLPSDWLRPVSPPGTRGTGMKGIGVAEEPRGRDSFGGNLARVIAEAYDFSRRFGQAQTMDATRFACVAMGFMAQNNLDPLAPWRVR